MLWLWLWPVAIAPVGPSSLGNFYMPPAKQKKTYKNKKQKKKKKKKKKKKGITERQLRETGQGCLLKLIPVCTLLLLSAVTPQ